MRNNVRKAVSLMGSPRVLVTSGALVALVVGASMTQGVNAAHQSVPRQAIATPVVIHTNPSGGFGVPAAADLKYITVYLGMAAGAGGGAHGTVDCPVGYYVISGGFSSGGSNTSVSENAPDPGHISWSVDIQNNDNSPVPLNIYAICAASSGTPGLQGGTGTQNIPGLTNLQYVTADGGIASANGGGARATVDCPAGDYVISGGLSSGGDDIAVSESAPDPSHTSWSVFIQNNEHVSEQLNAYAICANIG